MEYRIKFIQVDGNVLGDITYTIEDVKLINLTMGAQLKINGGQYVIRDQDVNFDTTTNTCTTEVSVEPIEE